MSREYTIWASTAAVLLIVGLLVGRQFPVLPGNADGELFRQWFWENRGLDLLAQVGLIFTGALAIAALLPRGKEDE